MDPITLLVISNPAAHHLKPLEQLPEPVNMLVGDDPEFLKKHAPRADVILNGMPEGDLLRIAFPLGKRVRWVHAMSAGIDKVLFPELIESPVPVTNGRGVFKDSLAQFSLGAILFFAKDFRRLVRNQEAGRWEQFDIVDVCGQTLGIVGFGEIGRATAELARAVGLKVVATRRRHAGAGDPLLERVYGPEQLHEMLAVSDYVVISTPLTPETRGLIGEPELNAMKRSAVLINIGRGPVVVESALIQALEQNGIKGAALDVFDVEPLPAGHPFYRMPNVLLSPHSADHTPDWAESAVQRFVENFKHFRDGKPFESIVDKKAGY